MIKCEVYYSMMRIMVKKCYNFGTPHNIASSALLSVRILIFLFEYYFNYFSKKNIQLPIR